MKIELKSWFYTILFKLLLMGSFIPFCFGEISKATYKDWIYFCKKNFAERSSNFQNCTSFERKEESVKYLNVLLTSSIKLGPHEALPSDFYYGVDDEKIMDEFFTITQEVLNFNLNSTVDKTLSKFDIYQRHLTNIAESKKLLIDVHPKKHLYLGSNLINSFSKKDYSTLVMLSHDYPVEFEQASKYNLLYFSKNGRHNLEINPINLVLSGGNCQCCLRNAISSFLIVSTNSGTVEPPDQG